jgi:hypothetical protein
VLTGFLIPPQLLIRALTEPKRSFITRMRNIRKLIIAPTISTPNQGEASLIIVRNAVSK